VRTKNYYPLNIVQLGEPATLTCALPKELSSKAIYWYKQNVGETLKLILALYKNTPPEYGPEFSNSRFNLNNDNNFSNLIILKTIREDEGIYHCGITEWINAEWSGTYLLVKGNFRTSNYSVVQQPTESKPVRTGDTVTLECSVLSESQTEACPGDYNVFWFRAGSQKSHPNIIYSDGNRKNECEKRSETQKNCVYHFSKNISAFDAGTYYCAVATCGEIIFGNGTSVELGIRLFKKIYLFLFSRTNNTINIYPNDLISVLVHFCHWKSDEELNYASMNFSERKTRGRQKREFAEDSVYSQVKC
uniref:Ig-like domain-containing protein n=1 Tax=Oreochromis aureus TaxID=47969 RepID=A0A668SBS8_OREAU